MKNMYALYETYKLDGDFRWIFFSHRWTGFEMVNSTVAFYEAFKRTVVGAMTCGLPTFATLHGCPAEIIIHEHSVFHIDPIQGEKSAELPVSFFEKCNTESSHRDWIP